VIALDLRPNAKEHLRTAKLSLPEQSHVREGLPVEKYHEFNKSVCAIWRQLRALAGIWQPVRHRYGVLG
jgi:hypothetical protein